jgi:LacI family transcriptional regulator, galactose operon repressor
MRKSATIHDVARRAAVSSATVSLVLNDVDARISEATAARVRTAAAELGYAPNGLARGLRRRRTDTIGLVSDHIATTPYAVHMVEGVQHVARQNGLLVFLVNTGGDAEVEQAAVAALGRQRVDGIIYACMYHRVVEVPPGAGPNTVLLDARTPDDTLPAVVPDDRGGARAAVTELLAHGHRRIGFITDQRGPVAADLRLAGYRDALRAYGVRFNAALVVPAEPDLASGATVARRLAENAGVTGLFCFNDRMAVGAMRGLAAAGLRVPRDVSVVGYDDQEFVAGDADPPLTTVALPHYAMGEWAARTLVDAINGTPALPGTHLMPCDLVRRDSVAPPPPTSRRSRSSGGTKGAYIPHNS